MIRIEVYTRPNDGWADPYVILASDDVDISYEDTDYLIIEEPDEPYLKAVFPPGHWYGFRAVGKDDPETVAEPLPPSNGYAAHGNVSYDSRTDNLATGELLDDGFAGPTS